MALTNIVGSNTLYSLNKMSIGSCVPFEILAEIAKHSRIQAVKHARTSTTAQWVSQGHLR